MSALDDLLKSRGIGGSGTQPAAVHVSLPEGQHRPPKTPNANAPRIYRDVIQGTPEWAKLRSGIPTASQFDRIVTPKGNPCAAKTQQKYMFELLAERMMGHPITEFTSRWMDRGSQTEAEAVKFYEFTRDLPTVKVGFITNTAGTIGCSPDRLVGEPGLLEIKVPSEGVHVAYLMQSGISYEEYKVQTQGQLWVAQKEWNDLFSYHPEMPEAIIRIERDEKFIRIMEELVMTFSLELERQFAICVERGWVTEKAAEEPSPSKSAKIPHLPPLEELTASQAMKEALLEMQRK